MTNKTDQTRPSALKKLSNLKIALAAAFLLLLSIGIAVYPTLRFIRGIAIGTLHPLAEFDSNEPYEFYDDNPNTAYWLAVQVDDRNNSRPQMDVKIDSPLGEVQTESIDRWSSIMGREHKQFLVITPPADGRFSINITTNTNEDFTISRRPEDVFNSELSRATPLWIAAGLPFVCSLILYGIVATRLLAAPNKVELQV